MMILLIILHVIACIGLIGIVLIQRGRGSGLVESFQGVESMFGTKTNEFLTRSTTVLSVIFFITCLSLAILSVKQSKSLMSNANAPIQADVSQETKNTEQKNPAAQEAVKKEEPVKQETPDQAPKTQAPEANKPK
ncbi:MAG: preprotein translocase subunit SecG [Candidatus Omnitrophica bacterium]|nr:preprotein translocase subunit SecG [Candidatus Omnitrophota bacterium]